ncbi:16S rRNA (uracil(1498)-N(3))-methyltransferase, partial [Rhodothermus marinus]|uniref:16S rRNA (uracil(1498)-N(3))-methyltransferase n=1 Tax=Rhodothermus marinus TaxID=29549 RepID=UPI001FB4A55A
MITTFYALRSLPRRVGPVAEDEAHHAMRVLRHHPGDEVIVVDGAGGWYRLCLEQVNRHGVR